MKELSNEGVPRLEIVDATIGYGDVRIVGGVQLSVIAGELVGLFGANGSGKSTIMRAVVGLAQLSQGRVEVNGAVVKKMSLETAARRFRIGYLPQVNRGIPALTVEENLELAAWGGGSRRNRRQVASAILKEPGFEKLATHRHRLVGTLSGGQRLRVALGMMELLNPEILLLDEPSSGADEDSSADLRGFLERQKGGSTGILLIEQDLEVLAAMCDKVYLVEGGRVNLASTSQ